MVKLTINDIPCKVKEGTTILEAAKTVGIFIPTLCYLKDINEIGACRVCVVEVDGAEKLVSACNTPVAEGMNVHSNTLKVREARRTNVELILSQHNGNCVTCSRSGNCALQTLANDLHIAPDIYPPNVPKMNWDLSFELIRDESKCIKCMRCIQICDKVQGLNIWNVANTGGRTTVAVSGLRNIRDTDCSLCGQCMTHCPVGALYARNDSIHDFSLGGPHANKDVIKIAQIAPAVRTSWGEPFGLSPEFATVQRLGAVLRRIGIDYVFDTTFSADLTIMEESAEVLHRLTDGKEHRYPMFTSCCPGWVRFIKSQYPDMVENLSTSKSPQAMFGAIAKTYFARKIGVEPERIHCVSIMPCVAKKAEIAIPSINDSGCDRDVDSVWSVREVDRLFRRECIDISQVPEEELDSPLGEGTGAGVIFGTTGGVMEAALRTAYFKLTGENPPMDTFKEIRTGKPWREAEFEIAGTTVRIAIVSGLGNARQLIRALRRDQVHYDFVEVMACPGGCVGGGGQPIHEGEEWAERRTKVLRHLDAKSQIRYSHENPEVQKLYTDYLGEPMSGLAEKLLHTDHFAWEMPLSMNLDHDVKVN